MPYLIEHGPLLQAIKASSTSGFSSRPTSLAWYKIQACPRWSWLSHVASSMRVLYEAVATLAQQQRQQQDVYVAKLLGFRNAFDRREQGRCCDDDTTLWMHIGDA
ncbi:hypothetical protein FOMPIDRAFT_1025082 [Fomitopsis schrenkii]|uniref:Uncharacterized protein n=1 Tax=Fomitopsis schrenkii TaxID=2126942 RepID=S8DVW1_FOMSC|nr:hypothetical protein FOMPIDRAFT_1025082 [Fomitopsis schrenkii]